MESSSLGLPRTPNRASSEGPTPPPRNSMEDADSSITRKRPRLDSGDRAYRSMSADPLSPGYNGPNTGATPLMPNDKASDHGPNGTPDITTKYSLDSTPSKVTINVRDPPLISPTRPPPYAITQPPLDIKPDLPSRSAEMRALDNVDASPPDIVTVSSSPPQSPEIQVAELEDVEGHTGPTVWRKSGTYMNLDDLFISLLNDFPLASQSTTLANAVNNISHTLASGSSASSGLMEAC